MNSYASRLTSLSELTGTFKSYDYLGLGTVVRRSHPQPAVDLTFLGTGPGTGGDQYVGLDSFGRVIDQNWKKGTSSTDRFTYTYDRDGNRLTKGNSVNAAFNESYSYDNLNQLSSFTRGSHSQSWDFDALGNWDSVTTAGTTQTRSHNKQNEITSVSNATTPTFDANGNMTTDETGKQYVYDAWNRIKIVKDSGGTTLKTYTYDALNHRVSETVGSNTTDLYYSAGWQVLEERVNGSGKYRYVWSPVYVDAMILRDRLDATERIWVQQDANFNVTAITDNSGVVLERYVYDSYGKATVLNASWTAMSGSGYAWQYLHQGGRLDATSGLYYFRNRDYSPTLGRWATMDPINFSGRDNNLYRFVANNPEIFVDPNGELFFIPPLVILIGVGFGILLDPGTANAPTSPNDIPRNSPDGLNILRTLPLDIVAGPLIFKYLPIVFAKCCALFKKTGPKHIPLSGSALGNNSLTVLGDMTVSEAGHATANIGLIWGRAANPFALLGNLKNLAKCNGATTLRIVADFSEELAPIAIRRYGFVQLEYDGKYSLDIIL